MKSIISGVFVLAALACSRGATFHNAGGDTPASLISLQMPLTVSDNNGGANTLVYGIAADATDGLDAHLGEYPLPPFPPSGSFEARFIINQFDASYKDFRQGTTAFTGGKVHTIQYQTGGTSVTVAWQLPPHVRGRLQDVILGTIVDVAMNGSGSFPVTNPLGINKLKITLTYQSGVPLAQPPNLIAPPNNASGVSAPVLFSWNAVNGCDAYRLQITRDQLFSSPEFDSLVSDTTRRVYTLPSAGQYFWRVRSVNAAGEGTFSSARTFSVILVSVREDKKSPHSFSLFQNFPNPFNPLTTIKYSTPPLPLPFAKGEGTGGVRSHEGNVRLVVYDLTGREVATLVNEEQVPGVYEVQFDAAALPSGAYFYELHIGEYRTIKKMLLQK